MEVLLRGLLSDRCLRGADDDKAMTGGTHNLMGIRTIFLYPQQDAVPKLNLDQTRGPRRKEPFYRQLPKYRKRHK